MNWDAIGAVGEILGALAVFVSLVYLAIQIKQNTRQMEHQIASLQGGGLSATETLSSNFRNSLARDSQVASLWRRGVEDYDSLSPDERTQAHWLFSDLFWIFQGLHIRQNIDSVDEESKLLLKINIGVYLENPGIRQWWPSGKVNYAPDFIALVEETLNEKLEPLSANET